MLNIDLRSVVTSVRRDLCRTGTDVFGNPEYGPCTNLNSKGARIAGGVIAGIVIGSIVFMIVCSVVAFILWRRSRTPVSVYRAPVVPLPGNSTMPGPESQTYLAPNMSQSHYNLNPNTQYPQPAPDGGYYAGPNTMPSPPFGQPHGEYPGPKQPV